MGSALIFLSRKVPSTVKRRLVFILIPLYILLQYSLMLVLPFLVTGMYITFVKYINDLVPNMLSSPLPLLYSLWSLPFVTYAKHAYHLVFFHTSLFSWFTSFTPFFNIQQFFSATIHFVIPITCFYRSVLFTTSITATITCCQLHYFPLLTFDHYLLNITFITATIIFCLIPLLTYHTSCYLNHTNYLYHYIASVPLLSFILTFC